MPVQLQSKCINIPVTLNCDQTAESWSLIGHSCWRPHCPEVCTKPRLFRALYPAPKSSGGGLPCFVFPNENMWTAAINRQTDRHTHTTCGLKPSTQTHTQTHVWTAAIHTHTHTHVWTAAIDRHAQTLFRTIVCGSSTTLTKTISPLTKQPGVTCVTPCFISYHQKAESKWQVICFL